MGTTKAAVTLIGLRVPVDQIVREEIIKVNKCKCTPKSDTGFFCQKCGMNTARSESKYVLKDPEYFYEDEGKMGLFTKDHPTITVVGDWRYGDKHLYIACFVSHTAPTYPAEGADPVCKHFSPSDEYFNNLQKDIITFTYEMKLHGLWNKDEFGLWTILLLA